MTAHLSFKTFHIIDLDISYRAYTVRSHADVIKKVLDKQKKKRVNMAARVVHLQWHLAPISVSRIEVVDSFLQSSMGFSLCSLYFFPPKTQHTEIVI